jgi:putative ribosome biogenesis GTPase RsgA
LAELDAYPALALLGEPGIGKSATLNRASSFQEEQVIEIAGKGALLCPECSHVI